MGEDDDRTIAPEVLELEGIETLDLSSWVASGWNLRDESGELE
jgi:hypothetical protein